MLGALGAGRTLLVDGLVEDVVVVVVAGQHELEPIGLRLQEAYSGTAHAVHAVRDEQGEVTDLLAAREGSVSWGSLHFRPNLPLRMWPVAVDEGLIGVQILAEPVDHKGLHAPRMRLELPPDPEVADVLAAEREARRVPAPVVGELAALGVQRGHLLQLRVPAHQRHTGGALVALKLTTGYPRSGQVVHVEQQLAAPRTHLQELGLRSAASAKASVVAAGDVRSLHHMGAVVDLAEGGQTVARGTFRRPQKQQLKQEHCGSCEAAALAPQSRHLGGQNRTELGSRRSLGL